MLASTMRLDLPTSVDEGEHVTVLEERERNSITSGADVPTGLMTTVGAAVVAISSQGFAGIMPAGSARIGVALAAIIMMLTVLARLRRALSVVARPLILAMLLWVLITTLLVADLGGGIIQMMLFLAVLLFPFVIQASLDRWAVILAAGTFIALVPSFVGYFLADAAVLRAAGSSGGYAGYFPWNSASGLCAALAILSVIVLIGIRGFSVLLVLSLSIPSFMLVVAGSATSNLALAGGLLAMAFVRLLKGMTTGSRLLAVTVGGFVSLVAFARLPPGALDIGAVWTASGRTSTATGRSVIWEHAVQGIQKSPWIGYGPDYWQGYSKSSAHNGFLDFALAWGVPAALGLLVMLAVAVVRLSSMSHQGLALLAFGVVGNLPLSQLAVPSLPALCLFIGVAMARPTGNPTRPRTRTADKGAQDAL